MAENMSKYLALKIYKVTALTQLIFNLHAYDFHEKPPSYIYVTIRLSYWYFRNLISYQKMQEASDFSFILITIYSSK